LTKQYFEDNGGGGPSGDYVKRIGDSMTGNLTMYQEDDLLPDAAPGIVFAVEDGTTTYGVIGKGNGLNDPFQMGSGNGRDLLFSTDGLGRVNIRDDNGHVELLSISETTSTDLDFVLDLDPKFRLSYDQTSHDLNLSNLTDGGVSFKTNGEYRVSINNLGWVYLNGYTSNPFNMFIQHDSVIKGGIGYNETDNRIELHGLDDANLSLHTNNRKDIEINSVTGRVEIITSWKCGDIICLGDDQSSGNASTLANFNAKDYGEIVEHSGGGISGTYNIEIRLGNVHSISMTGPTTFELDSYHINYSFNMILYGTKDITWPANAHWPDGVEPTLVDNEIDMVLCQVVGPRAFFSVVQNFIGTPAPEPSNCTVYPADTSGNSVDFTLDSGCISQREDGSYAAYYNFSGVPNGWLAYIRIINDGDISLPLNYIHLIEGNDPINGSTVLDSDYSAGAESVIQYYNNSGDENTEFSVEFGILPAGTSNSSITYVIDISMGA